jgi:hypothetical protein
MGFRKTVKSKKGVDMEYWRLVSVHLLEDGTLNMHIRGYKDGPAYSAGADPIDEYSCIVSNADTAIKEPFYEFLEKCFPLFAGAIKDVTYSRRRDGKTDPAVTVLTPKGDIVFTQNNKLPVQPDTN